MRPYIAGEDVSDVSISTLDKQNGSPKDGDMIARNPENHDYSWLVAEKYFKDNFDPAYQPERLELKVNGRTLMGVDVPKAPENSAEMLVLLKELVGFLESPAAQA